MRTAEEISAKVFNSYAFSQNEREAMIKLINEARREAIEEAAERATFNQTLYDAYNHTQVDKESILSLINELK